MEKLILLFFTILSFQNSWAQKELNNYKYVIVPKRFDFQSKPNSYRINSLTKYLLNKIDFNTLLDDQVLPDDALKNRCLALNVKLLVKSNMLRTNVRVAFINCRNKVVYTSGEGTSREKEYQKSYQEAIRGAFNSLGNYKFTYTPQQQLVEKEKINDVVKPIVKNKVEAIKNVPKHKPLIKKESTKVTLPVVIKPQVKDNKTLHISGLYIFDNETYEIAQFKGYYIFSKHSDQGKVYKSKPLGFIYKTSKKGNYLIKTNDTFTGYLLKNGNFVIDEVDKDGAINSKIFIKNNN